MAGGDERLQEQVLDRLGLAGWSPPGHRDERSGVWFVDGGIDVSFPDAGIDVFEDVDGGSFWFDHRNAVITTALEHHAPARAVVEVGSGSGVVADHLTRSGWAVAAVEPVPAGARAAARRRVPLSLCGDLASLKLPDRALPAVGAFDVIEHLADPLPLLAEARRVLRHDGVLVLTVPAYQWLWSDFDRWNGHHRRYTVDRLRREVRRAGFTVRSDTHLFAPLLPPAALQRTVLRRAAERRAALLGRERAGRSADEIERRTAAELRPATALVDRSVRAVLAAEARWLRRRRLPVGTSILLVAEPDAG